MGLVGGGRFFRRPFAHVGDAQGRGDDRDFGGATVPAGLDEHPCQPGIQGHAGHLAAAVGQAQVAAAQGRIGRRGLLGHLYGPQLFEELDPVADAFVRWPVDEGEIGDIPQAQGDHAQHDFGQIGAQDLRGGEARAVFVVRLAVEADADPVGHPAAAPGALVAARLADGGHGQGRGATARRIAGDARQARVHHVADPGDGDGGLGHVGGHDDLAPGARGKDPQLVGGRQPGKEGQDRLGTAAAGFQQLHGVADILFGGHEDQHVAPGPAAADAVHRGRGGLHVGGRFIAGPVFQGLPAYRDRVGAARNLDNRSVAEGRGEFAGIDGSRGDDQLQIPAAFEQGAQQPQGEIDVQAPFVGLVHDQGVVCRQAAVALGLGQQDPVGHDLDVGLGAGAVGKADLVAHGLAQGLAQLLGDAPGHGQGRDAPRLGTADEPVEAPAGVQAELGQLGGFARAGLPDTMTTGWRRMASMMASRWAQMGRAAS